MLTSFLGQPHAPGDHSGIHAVRVRICPELGGEGPCNADKPSQTTNYYIDHIRLRAIIFGYLFKSLGTVFLCGISPACVKLEKSAALNAGIYGLN